MAPVAAQGCRRLAEARKKLRLRGDIFLVMRNQPLAQAAQLLRIGFAAEGGNRGLKHRLGAIAHALFDRRGRRRAEPLGGQRRVRRFDQVGGRVGDCAIEIEDDGYCLQARFRAVQRALQDLRSSPPGGTRLACGRPVLSVQRGSG